MKATIQLYIRNVGDSKKMLVGVIDSPVDLCAENYTSFLFGGIYTPSENLCDIEIQRDPTSFSYQKLGCGAYPSIDGALISSSGWRMAKTDISDLFAGQMIVFRTISTPDGNEYRYLLFSAISCDAFNDVDGAMLVGDFSGLNDCSTINIVSTGELFRGSNASQILQAPAWGPGEPRGHISTIEMRTQNLLSEMTALIAQDKPLSDELVDFSMDFGQACKNKEYANHLKFMWQKWPEYFSRDNLRPKTKAELEQHFEKVKSIMKMQIQQQI